MQCFVQDLKRTTSKLFRDEIFLDHERQNIRNLLVDGQRIHEDVLKSFWILHRQRVKLLFSGRLAKSNGARQAWFSKLRFERNSENRCHTYYLEVIRHLRDNPNLVANLLVLYESNPEILEILCFLILSALGNFAMNHQDVLFLANVIHAVQPRPPRLPMDYIPFASLFNVCFCDTYQAHRFMCILLHDVLARISEVTYVPDRHNNDEHVMHGAGSLSRSIFYSDVRCLPRCFSDEEFCFVVNLLIRRFIEAAPLFPKPLLILLKNYRQRLPRSENRTMDLYSQSVEFLIGLFVVRAIMQPLLYGYYSDRYLDPSGRKILHQVASAFKFLALKCNPSQNSNNHIRAAPELGIALDKLIKLCDVGELHAAFEHIFELADKSPNVQPTQNSDATVFERQPSTRGLRSKTSLGVLPTTTDEVTAPPVTIITASDLNVLIDCLRIFVEQQSDGHENLRKTLKNLPPRVPGALVGVRTQSGKHQAGRGKNKQCVPSGSASKPYELICFDVTKDKQPPPTAHLRNDPSRTSPIPIRSGSTGHLAVHDSRMDHRSRHQNQFGSLGRVSPLVPVTQVQSDPSLRDSGVDGHPYETVFVIPHFDSCRPPQDRILSEQEFLRSGETDPSQIDAYEVYTELFSPSSAVEHPATTNNELLMKPSNPVSQSQSSSGLSRSSGDVDEADDQEDDVGDANSSPRHAYLYDRLLDSSQCNLLDNSFTGGGEVDVLNTTNEEELLAGEDRSNDRSSDVSEHSGCTSLASSAHALGRRMQRATILADSSLTSDDLAEVPPVRTATSQGSFKDEDPAAGPSSTRGTHSGQTPFVEAVEKRTRFSVSDFPRASGSYTTHGETQRSAESRPLRSSPFSERNRKSNGSKRPNARLARTSSEELVMNHNGFVSEDEPQSRVARDITDSGSSLNSHQSYGPNPPIRSSSLSNLQSSSTFRARSLGLQETGDDDQSSLPTPDNQEVDERSSVRTCSSCGIRVGTSGRDPLPPTVTSQVPLDDSNLVERLDEEDALSDLPLSSANVSGRVTPLSLASSTSRATSGVLNPNLIDPSNVSRGPVYSRAGIVLPTAPVTASGTNSGMGRCCMIDFSSTIIQRNISSDVTDKFGKFDLPPARIPESEARSTVSDTWSTDVLPSDTEYPENGPDPLGSDISNGRPHHHHHHHHTHHHRHNPHRNHPSSSGRSSHPNRSGQILPVVEQHSDYPRTTSEEAVPLGSQTQPIQASTSFLSYLPHADRHCNRQTPMEPDLETNPGHEVSSLSQQQHSTQPIPRIPNGSVVQLDARLRVNPSDSSALTMRPSTTAPTLSVPHGDSSSARSVHSRSNSHAEYEPSAGDDVLSTSNSSTRLADGVQLIKDGCSKLKSRVVLRSRFSLKQSVNPANSPRSVFHWNPEQRPDGDSSKRVQASSQLESNIDQSMTRNPDSTTSHSAPGTSNKVPLSCSPASLSSHATHSLSPSSSAHSLNIDPDGSTTRVIPDSSANTMLVTGEESVEQMMARYRTKTDALRRVTVNFPRSEEVKPDNNSRLNSDSTSSVGLFGDWISDSRQILATQSLESLRNQVRRGLQLIFSNSMIGSIGRQVVDKLEFTFQTSPQNLQDLRQEDAFFFAVLQALLAEAITLQDSVLTTTIRETGRLFHLLVDCLKNNQLVQSDPRSSGDHSPPRYNAIVPGLLAELRAERRRRHEYFAYLIRTNTSVAQANRYLETLKLRLQRDLILQCDNILYNAIASFLDSQLESFEEFYTRMSKARSSNEADELPHVARGLVNHFIHTLVTKWNALSLQLFSAPMEDPDFAYLSKSVSAESHLIRLVMEKVYRSGIWMNDASVERERDVLLHRELASLGHLFSLNDLQISERFHILQPFMSVQEELRMFDQSHVPNEMVRCLKRVNQQIVTTLALVSPNSPPSADDLLPVLIYVIIQVNPPRLLTNISFIETFGTTLEGEDQYSWCQFRAAVAEVRRLLSSVLLDEDGTPSRTG